MSWEGVTSCWEETDLSRFPKVSRTLMDWMSHWKQDKESDIELIQQNEL